MELQINLFSHRMSYQHNIFQGPVAWVTFQSAHMPASPPPPHHFGESRLRGHLWNVSTLTMISSFELSLLPLLWPHVNMCPHVHSLWSTKKQSQREIISSTAPFQSLGSGVHRNSCLWRTHSLATGRSLYSLNLVIKGENGRAKQGGKAHSEYYRQESIPAGVNYKAELFPSSHVIFSPNLFSGHSEHCQHCLPTLALFLISLTFHPNQIWVSIFAPALSPLLFPTGYNLQSPELLLKMILKHLCVQSFCRSTCIGHSTFTSSLC